MSRTSSRPGLSSLDDILISLEDAKLLRAVCAGYVKFIDEMLCDLPEPCPKKVERIRQVGLRLGAALHRKSLETQNG